MLYELFFGACLVAALRSNLLHMFQQFVDAPHLSDTYLDIERRVCVHM